MCTSRTDAEYESFCDPFCLSGSRREQHPTTAVDSSPWHSSVGTSPRHPSAVGLGARQRVGSVLGLQTGTVDGGLDHGHWGAETFYLLRPGGVIHLATQSSGKKEPTHCNHLVDAGYLAKFLLDDQEKEPRKLTEVFRELKMRAEGGVDAALAKVKGEAYAASGVAEEEKLRQAIEESQLKFVFYAVNTDGTLERVLFYSRNSWRARVFSSGVPAAGLTPPSSVFLCASRASTGELSRGGRSAPESREGICPGWARLCR